MTEPPTVNDRLDEIEDAIAGLDALLDLYLTRIPSPILANARANLSHVLGGVMRERERLGAVREREARIAANAADRAARMAPKSELDDPFTIAQAQRLGITPQAFLDLVAERQREARQGQ